MAAAALTGGRLLPSGAAYVAPLLSFMLLAFNLLIVLMLGWSIGVPPDVLEHYSQIVERAAAAVSGLVALAASSAALVLGSIAAYGLVRGSFRGRAILEGNFIAPLILPPVITAVARSTSASPGSACSARCPG